MARGRLLPPSRLTITTLAGGVGAAKFIRGLVRRVDPRRLSIVVNTGDDEDFYGLHVSPDGDSRAKPSTRSAHLRVFTVRPGSILAIATSRPIFTAHNASMWVRA